MNSQKFIDDVKLGKLSRREFHKGLAAFGIGVASIPLVPRLAAAADDPTVFVWGGFEDPGFHGQYEAQHGSLPNFSQFGDEEEAFAKMRAGFEPDVTMACSYKAPHWYDAGIIKPIDVSRLPNFDDSIELLKDVPGTQFDGQRAWVCMDWGLTTLCYRHDLVDMAPEDVTWGLLWDERYSGRLAMIDSLIDGVMVAAIYGGAANPFDMTAAEVETTRALLKQQLPLLRYYSNSMTDLQTSLASGELVAAAVWNEAYVGLMAEGHPVTFATDMPGLMTWTCGLTLNSWTENEAAAYDVMDSMLSPDAGVYEIMEWGYGHANTKSYEMISDDDLAARGLSRTPNAIISAGIFQEPIVNEPELQSMFEEVKAGF
jgi:spermidine/putrescine transport system substrate-binding protein